MNKLTTKTAEQLKTLLNVYKTQIITHLACANADTVSDTVSDTEASTAYFTSATETIANFMASELEELKQENTRLKQLIAINVAAFPIADAVGCILHKGKPPGLHECSTCREKKESSYFNYYSQRVDQHGYLMRSNALCKLCTELSNRERKETLQKASQEGKIPTKPIPGDICPKCTRHWGSAEAPRNWHRDHDAIKNEFRGWLCGDCNMAQHDHRHGTS